MPTSDAVKAAQDHVQSVASALHLLETLAGLKRATLSQLARGAKLTMNQTFRLLATLEAEGYVVRDQDKVYHLGPKLHLLGQHATWPHDLISSAATALDGLAGLSGETVLLSVPVGVERMIVDSRPSRHSLRVDYPIGSRVPLYVGGMGLVLLAFSPSEVLEKVLDAPRYAFTEHTLTSPKALEKELARLRRERVRVSRDDYAVGEFSVATPILDGAEHLRGALSIAGFTARLDAEAQERYTRAVLEVATKIGSKL